MNAAVASRPQASAPSRQALHIPSLDGMRAVAFFVVFLAHARLWTRFPGNFGVTMFFFLSGFLITTLLRMEAEDTGRVSLKQFYLRRVLRIFPPFYLILGTTVVLISAGVLVGDAWLTPVASQMVHLANFRIIFGGYAGYPLGTYAYWSLAVEEHFYLVFPLTYIFMRRYLPGARRQALFLAGICVAVLLWRCVLVFALDASKDRTYIATDTRVDSILFGCILALFGNPVLDRVRIPERLLKWVLLPASILVLLVTFAFTSPVLKETVRYTLQGLALYPIFIAAILYPAWGPFRLLNLGFVKFLGLLSYSLYLLHEIIIYNIYPKIPATSLVQAAVALAISVALASLIYYVIERPCARLRKRLSYRFAGPARRAAHRAAEPAAVAAR
jgi:peptidoglycan/LPS O-acetylase OafA/YrhL